MMGSISLQGPHHVEYASTRSGVFELNKSAKFASKRSITVPSRDAVVVVIRANGETDFVEVLTRLLVNAAQCGPDKKAPAR
jgi:hypothetical protein